MKAVQYFSDEYLENCKGMTSDQILEFLESFRLMQHQPGKLQQINLRVPQHTLIAFKARAKQQGTSYQRKIRELMTAWAINSE